MVRNVWSKTLWDYRFAILGWGCGLGLYLFIDFAYYATLSPAGHQQVIQLAQFYRFLGDPVAINTAEGFATWNAVDLLPVVLGIWVLLAGANLTRREEENGALDVMVATISRQRLFLAKLTALVSALGGIALFIALGALVGEAAAHVAVEPGRAVLTGVAVSLTALVFGMLALLLGQLLANARAAAGITGALMGVCYALDGLGRTQSKAQPWQQVSPFYSFGQIKPLIPTYPSQMSAGAFLLGLSVLLGLGSFLLFIRRDLGSAALPVERVTRSKPVNLLAAVQRSQRDVFLRLVSLQELRTRLATIGWWMVGLGGYAILMTLTAQGTEASLQQVYAQNPTVAKLFAGQDMGTNAGFLQATVFLYLPVITTFFALTLAHSWPADLEKGRLELLLSTPQPRWRVLFERFLTVMLGTLLVALVIGLGVLLGASLEQLKLDAARVMAAALCIWPLELVTASVVFLLSRFLRAGAVFGTVGTLIAISYLVNLLSPLLALPTWVVDLSVFFHYGAPLVHGVAWKPILAMLAAVLVVLVGATAFWLHADLEGGS